MTRFNFKGHQIYLVLFFFVWQCTKAPAPEQHLFSGSTMGTTYSIKLVHSGTLDTARVKAEIQAVVDRVDALMSNWKEDSEVSQFERLPANEPFPISEETRKVLEVTLSVALKTDGALDPTVSPLIELWGFGTKSLGEFPTEQQVSELKKETGYQFLTLNNGTLSKSKANLKLNLGAVAKGFALDAMAQYLEKQGFDRYLVEIGRELRGKGTNLSGTPWRVAIENPDSEAITPILHVVSLENKSIATSGDYRQFFEYQGKEYSHIIDPRTGWPIEPNITLASVIAPRCAVADAWSTALMVLSVEEGLALIENEPNLECLLVQRLPEGKFKIYKSTGMDKYFINGIGR